MTRGQGEGPLSLELSFDWSPAGALPQLARHLRARPDGEALRHAVDRAPPALHPIARRCWEARVRSEYVGVMLCRKLHGLLVDLNAPLDLQELALLMTLQEQQHSALCADALAAIGGERWVPCPLDELQQVRQGSPEEELGELLWGTFLVGEFVALELLRESIQTLPSSPFRDILREIARDEVLHGRLALELLPVARAGGFESWFPYPGDEELRRIIERFREGLRRRDVIEEEALVASEEPAHQAALAALGLSEPRGFLTRYRSAIDERLPAALAAVGFSL